MRRSSLSSDNAFAYVNPQKQLREAESAASTAGTGGHAALQALAETIRYGRRKLYGRRFASGAELFLALDRNSDGLIDTEEMVEGLRRLDVVLTSEELAGLLAGHPRSAPLDMEAFLSILESHVPRSLLWPAEDNTDEAPPGTPLEMTSLSDVYSHYCGGAAKAVSASSLDLDAFATFATEFGFMPTMLTNHTLRAIFEIETADNPAARLDYPNFKACVARCVGAATATLESPQLPAGVSVLLHLLEAEERSCVLLSPTGLGASNLSSLAPDTTAMSDSVVVETGDGLPGSVLPIPRGEQLAVEKPDSHAWRTAEDRMRAAVRHGQGRSPTNPAWPPGQRSFLDSPSPEKLVTPEESCIGHSIGAQRIPLGEVGRRLARVLVQIHCHRRCRAVLRQLWHGHVAASSKETLRREWAEGLKGEEMSLQERASAMRLREIRGACRLLRHVYQRVWLRSSQAVATWWSQSKLHVMRCALTQSEEKRAELKVALAEVQGRVGAEESLDFQREALTHLRSDLEKGERQLQATTNQLREANKAVEGLRGSLERSLHAQARGAFALLRFMWRRQGCDVVRDAVHRWLAGSHESQRSLQAGLEARLEEAIVTELRLQSRIKEVEGHGRGEELRAAKARAELAEMQLAVAQEQEAMDRERLLGELEIRAASMMEANMLEMKRQHQSQTERLEQEVHEVRAEKDSLAGHIIDMAESLKETQTQVERQKRETQRFGQTAAVHILLGVNQTETRRSLAQCVRVWWRRSMSSYFRHHRSAKLQSKAIKSGKGAVLAQLRGMQHTVQGIKASWDASEDEPRPGVPHPMGEEEALAEIAEADRVVARVEAALQQASSSNELGPGGSHAKMEVGLADAEASRVMAEQCFLAMSESLRPFPVRQADVALGLEMKTLERLVSTIETLTQLFNLLEARLLKSNLERARAEGRLAQAQQEQVSLVAVIGKAKGDAREADLALESCRQQQGELTRLQEVEKRLTQSLQDEIGAKERLEQRVVALEGLVSGQQEKDTEANLEKLRKEKRVSRMELAEQLKISVAQAEEIQRLREHITRTDQAAALTQAQRQQQWQPPTDVVKPLVAHKSFLAQSSPSHVRNGQPLSSANVNVRYDQCEPSKRPLTAPPPRDLTPVRSSETSRAPATPHTPNASAHVISMEERLASTRSRLSAAKSRSSRGTPQGSASSAMTTHTQSGALPPNPSC